LLTVAKSGSHPATALVALASAPWGGKFLQLACYIPRRWRHFFMQVATALYL